MDHADLTDIADGRNIAVMTVPLKPVQAVVSAAFVLGAADTLPLQTLFREILSLPFVLAFGLLLRGYSWLLFAQDETVFVAVAVSILSHDVAARVDIIKICRNGSRKINGSKPAIAQQKAVIVAAAVNSAPHNVASRIDPKATNRLCDSRDIDGGKSSIAQQKAMEVTATVDVEPYDVASRVDPFHIGKNGSRKNDGVEHTIAQQKAVNIIAGVTVFTRDIAARINSIEDGESGSRHIDAHKCTVAQQKTMNVAIAGTI